MLERLDGRNKLAQLHWGGGTPTYYSPADLADLFGQLTDRFQLEPDAEIAIEIDPRITTEDHVSALYELGFNRISMGVQDADEHVQELIGRNQTWHQTVTTYEQVRSLGTASVNIDLIYGLPGQSEATFAETIEKTIALRPDRLAVYSFAFVPWMRKQQKRIPLNTLPERETKFALMAMAIREFEAAGYERIGMDHFALPTDELVEARAKGTLARTFMGYTVLTADDVIGLGSSAIGDVQGAYVQSHRRLASYYQDVDSGELPVERGVVLSEDDRIRRHVITSLMCNDTCDVDLVESRFGIDFATYFEWELEELTRSGGLVEEGFVALSSESVNATELGSLFIRNIAIVFDQYRRPAENGQTEVAQPGAPVFSRTV